MAGIMQKSCVSLFPVVGYIDVKQQETFEKLKNRGWYSTYDDNTAVSTATATTITSSTNKSHNNSNIYNKVNVIMIKRIITTKMKSGCALKKIKSNYVYCLPHFFFGEKKNAS